MGGRGGGPQLTSNFCRNSSLPSSPSGGTGTLKYSPSSWLSSLNLGRGKRVIKTAPAMEAAP